MRFFCRGERLFAREWISVQALRDDSNARLVDDTASRHPDNGFGQDLLFWVSRGMHAKNGTDAKGTSVTIFAYSAQRFLVRDPAQEHCGMTVLRVILACFWPGSRVPAKNGSSHRNRAVPIFAQSRLVITLQSVQRDSDLKVTAVLTIEMVKQVHEEFMSSFGGQGPNQE